MNDEIREAFSDLCHEMMLAYQRENGSLIDPRLSNDEKNLIFFVSQRYNHFGCVLDEVRLGIEVSGYKLRHNQNLCIILRFLEEVNDSKLRAKLQGVVDLLGDPSPPTNVQPALAAYTFCDRSYSIDFWYEYLVKACKILHETLGDRFDMALGFTGSGGRRFFSRAPDVLVRAELIPGTDIYVERNLGSKAIRQTVKDIAEYFGVKPPQRSDKNVR